MSLCDIYCRSDFMLAYTPFLVIYSYQSVVDDGELSCCSSTGHGEEAAAETGIPL